MFNIHLMSFDDILCRKMGFFINSFWSFVINSLLFLIGFISKHVFRIKKEDCEEEEDCEFMEREQSDFEEEETSSLSFKFEYQISEDSLSCSEEPAMVTNVSKYCFLSENDFKGFVHEPEYMTFHIQESFADPGDENFKSKLSSEEDHKTISVMNKNKFMLEEFSGFESDSESSTSDGYSVKNLAADSDSDGFLSDVDCGGYECESDSTVSTMNSKNCNSDTESNISKVMPLNSSEFIEAIALKEDDQISEAIEELHHISDKILGNNSSNLDENLLELISDPANKQLKENNEEIAQKFETKYTEISECEELDELEEELWEHRDLIEQLKMELKKVRGIGLPTIFEESESPKSVEDLQPWKIDAKFLQEDPMDELLNFHKCYRERMRKFDILNYQKMYSIGFLKLKDPLQSLGNQKSILSQNLWPFRHRKCTSDASKKFIKELQNDLETVYVGQTCLSWEFLRWQYEKAHLILYSNKHRVRQYNQVAGELQQFQVIIQRFLENEPFQGPRLPNYVKNRCVLRNLVQVPVIKEDCMKDKMEGLRKGNKIITSDMIEDILEESINIFWDFIKADKDETPLILKGLFGPQVELQDPSDFDIMVHAQAILHKKEKKLKDILRTGNCLVKKFKKPREDRSNQDIFFSQVDLKLVSRVLRMPKMTTDQLIWCHKKLEKITFSDGKVQRESAFLLFPC
ncbi:Ribosomal protein L34Ae protein [Dioscorea alata]|uniref:Ribosomal protein L34Ae protein n=1 Tax=Dioscorea alata TaxID=55571 RepID=A0ACB7W8Q8_DIOAL|nr:Ribosomal protein L34Ae protein [Dioscorea alata]